MAGIVVTRETIGGFYCMMIGFSRNLAVRATEAAMAGYGLVVLMFAVATATAGYYWMRDD